MSPVERALVEFVCPGEIEPRPLATALGAEPVPGRPLAGDFEGGNGVALLDLPAGWRGGGDVERAFELIVLDGALTVDGEPLPRFGYLSVPAGGAVELAADAPATVWIDVTTDVEERRVVPDLEEGWDTSGRLQLVPGPPPGLVRKMIRGEMSGARGFFLRVPADWEETRTEWHDCAEACVVLEGDLWHVRANGGAGGVMRPGCYFWRPAGVLHSPMGSDTGATLYITVDGELVNHYEETPPELLAAAAGRERTR